LPRAWHLVDGNMVVMISLNSAIGNPESAIGHIPT